MTTYDFYVKTFSIDLDNPENNAKTTRESRTWDFDEFMKFVEQESLILSYASRHEHILFNPPYYQYNLSFAKPVNKRKAYIYDLTLHGFLAESDCEEFENKLSETELFKTYKAKRIAKRKEALPKYKVAI